MRDRYGGYISEGWLWRRAWAYALAGETPPPIVVDERGIAHESNAATRAGGDSLDDTRLCGLCDEVVEGYRYHSGCCFHEEVEEDDARDGAGGRLAYFCAECGEEVTAEMNEDGGLDWSLV